jgi:hypothetical protein
LGASHVLAGGIKSKRFTLAKKLLNAFLDPNERQNNDEIPNQQWITANESEDGDP